MTRDELVAMVASYAKRGDLDVQITSMFIPLAESEIGTDLKSAENEASTELEVTDNQFALPPDYGSIRAVQNKQSGGTRTLTSLDLHSINNWPETGGSPARYLIQSGLVTVRPFVAGTYPVFYYSRPQLTSGDDSNAVLDRFPQLYLYATLTQLRLWQVAAGDPAVIAATEPLYNQTVTKINKDADRARGEKPAMRRA